MRLCLLLFAVGCTSAKDGLDTSENATGSHDTAGDPTAPTVRAVSLADCAPDTDGVERWSVQIDVTDPQGDIASVGSTVAVMDGETALATYSLACTDDSCSGSWSANYDNITCDVGRASVFRFLVVDDFGHVSDPYDYTPPA